jgi:hypothetical protein
VQRCDSSALVWAVENPHILQTWVNRLIIEEFGGWAKYQALLRAMRNVSDRHSTASGCTIAMVAMAWVLAQEGVGAIIVGMYACGGNDCSDVIAKFNVGCWPSACSCCGSGYENGVRETCLLQ